MKMIKVREVGPEQLALYATIPIAFQVRSQLRVAPVERGLSGLALVEEPVDPPYTKDYDDDPWDRQPGDEGLPIPLTWPRRFDVRNWGIFMAFEQERALGGATVVFDTPEVHMLEGRRDLAVLWDIRVRPDHRGKGIGTALFQHAAAWSRQRGCTQLKIETQNINVRACRFYRQQGCELGAIHRYAYAGCPPVAHEAMLLWYLDLPRE